MTIVPQFSRLDRVTVNGKPAFVQDEGVCDMWDVEGWFCARPNLLGIECPLKDSGRCLRGIIALDDNRIYVQDEEGGYHVA